MRGNRYPITDIGIENLIIRLIENGERDRNYDECEVEINRSIKINGHTGTEIRIVHPFRRDHFKYHISRVFIDDQLNLPVGYEGYVWPDTGETEPKLVERYFYKDLELNVGLTNKDFDPENSDYDYR